MSSSPTAPTSTTRFVDQLPFPAGLTAVPRPPPVAVIACGALGGHVREIAARRGWPVEVHTLPALLHNRPERIAPGGRASWPASCRPAGLRVALGYADCGSYGALDELCARLGLRRLPGLHCYDVLGRPGPDARAAGRRARHLPADRLPGAQLPTGRCWPSWAWTGTRSCGRTTSATTGGWSGWPRPATPALDAEAAADSPGMFGLPLTVIDTGTGGLERELERARVAEPADRAVIAACCAAAGCTAWRRCCGTRGTRCCPRPAPSRRCWSGCRAS